MKKLNKRICIKCKEEKDFTEFDIRSDTKTFRKECKMCKQEYNKKYYINNKLKIQKLHKLWKENNKDKLIKIRKKNKKIKAEYDKNYKIINKDKYNQYQRNKRKDDISFKIAFNYRIRINEALKGKTKSLSTMFLIGCEIDYLMFHIQSQFKEGMSWDNYGSYWEIDHIKPCSRFDLSKKKEQLECFNYKNLQPLTKLENKKKGNKL